MNAETTINNCDLEKTHSLSVNNGIQNSNSQITEEINKNKEDYGTLTDETEFHCTPPMSKHFCLDEFKLTQDDRDMKAVEHGMNECYGNVFETKADIHAQESQYYIRNNTHNPAKACIDNSTERPQIKTMNIKKQELSEREIDNIEIISTTVIENTEPSSNGHNYTTSKYHRENHIIPTDMNELMYTKRDTRIHHDDEKENDEDINDSYNSCNEEKFIDDSNTNDNGDTTDNDEEYGLDGNKYVANENDEKNDKVGDDDEESHDYSDNKSENLELIEDNNNNNEFYLYPAIQI